ncbi:phosphoglucosamine mutase [Patescibacteria group bacterium]|nr:phosphoglucosamine mutase [Patescibacteria group bacterium]
MTKKFFGTDGIRGEANKKLTPKLALEVGMAAGIHFRNNNPHHRHRVLIGKDTRLSCYMLEQALTAGFLSAGMHVFLTGPIPTPGVAALTRSMRADLGVMITASHNPFEDNGVKLFGPDGYKLSDDEERSIEQLMLRDHSEQLAYGDRIGRAQRINGVADRYIELVKSVVPDIDFEGFRVVIDCANGAAYKVAPLALEELGAEVFAIGVEPNGVNINSGCGSTNPLKLQAEVRRLRADIGIALDGDADRVLLVDEKGNVVDGDQILALIATNLKNRGLLKNGVVGTVMTNGGFERYCGETLETAFFRADVGDRYVLERMRKFNVTLGGEQSGHIIMSDYATTGDGLMAALQVLSILKETEQPMSAIADCFEPIPQELRNIRAPKERLGLPTVIAAIEAAKRGLGELGRLIVRPSGTEPLIRVMVEHPDRKLIEQILQDLTPVIVTAQ